MIELRKKMASMGLRTEQQQNTSFPVTNGGRDVEPKPPSRKSSLSTPELRGKRTEQQQTQQNATFPDIINNNNGGKDLEPRPSTCCYLLSQHENDASFPDIHNIGKDLEPRPSMCSLSSSSEQSSLLSRESSEQSLCLDELRPPPRKSKSLDARQQLYLTLQQKSKQTKKSFRHHATTTTYNNNYCGGKPPRQQIISTGTSPIRAKSLDTSLSAAFGNNSSQDLFYELRDKGVSKDEAAARQRRLSRLKQAIGYFEDD